MKPAALICLTTLWLAGCSYVATDTVARLSALSPLEADPGDIALAVRIPDGISAQAGGLQLHLVATRTDTGQALSETVRLEQSKTAGLDIFQIDKVDHMRLRAAQAKARMWEAEAPEATSGALSLSATFCRSGDGPAEDATLSALIRLSPTGAFQPLISNAPLSVVNTTKAGRDSSAVPPC